MLWILKNTPPAFDRRLDPGDDARPASSLLLESSRALWPMLARFSIQSFQFKIAREATVASPTPHCTLAFRLDAPPPPDNSTTDWTAFSQCDRQIHPPSTNFVAPLWAASSSPSACGSIAAVGWPRTYPLRNAERTPFRFSPQPAKGRTLALLARSIHLLIDLAIPPIQHSHNQFESTRGAPVASLPRGPFPM